MTASRPSCRRHSRLNRPLAGAALLLASIVTLSWAAPQPTSETETRPRPPGLQHPVALVVDATGRSAYVANRTAGTIAIIDLIQSQVVGESQVGERLSSLALCGDWLLATDDLQHEVIVLRRQGTTLRVIQRLTVPAFPVDMASNSRGTMVAVVSLWSQQLTLLERLASMSDREDRLIRHTQIALPFAARRAFWLDDDLVVVAEAFGGRLAVIERSTGRIRATHETGGHNLGRMCLAWDGKTLLVPHQVLTAVPITEENLATGRVLRNVLTKISVEDLRASDCATLRSESLPLDGPAGGAGDPSAVLALNHASAVVACGGVQQLIVVPLIPGAPARRIPVGARPLNLRRIGGELLVLNGLSDSVTRIEIASGRRVADIRLGPELPLTPQNRGEQLFFDARPSRGGLMSCHSCHTEGHTNGLLADTLGDHTHGTPKRTLSLFGTAYTYRWAWNGQIANLHEQVRKSFDQTLHARNVAADSVTDLVSYLHSLPFVPPPAPEPADAADQQLLDKGKSTFAKHGCAHCHIPPLVYSSHEAYDVGLTDERGQATFNPPTLRGVGQGRYFLHDNRARSLEDVFRGHGHPSGTVAEEEIAPLVRFLRSL